MHILSIMEKLEDVWSSGITKEKGEKSIVSEEKPWLVRLLNRTGVLLVVNTFQVESSNNLVTTAHLL